MTLRKIKKTTTEKQNTEYFAHGEKAFLWVKWRQKAPNSSEPKAFQELQPRHLIITLTMLKKTEKNIEKSTTDKQNKKKPQTIITSEPKSFHELQSRHQNIALTLLEKTLRNIEKSKAEQQKKRKLRITITKASPKKGNTKATKHVSAKIISWASTSSSKHHVDIVGKHIEGQRKANSWRGKQRKFRSRLAKLIRNCEFKIHKKSAQITRWASTSSSEYKFDKVEKDIEEHRKTNGWAAK